MKNIFYLMLVSGLVIFNACGDKDDEMHSGEPNYIIDIVAPGVADKTVGDMVSLEANVKEEHGGTLHHFNLKIYNKVDETEVIYDGPSEAHVHEEDGDFTYTDEVLLDVHEDTDWVVEVKVSGHEAGHAEKIETIEFHVHPM